MFKQNRVYEGDPFVRFVDPVENADMTYEYYYMERWGLGIVTAANNAGIGRYEISE